MLPYDNNLDRCNRRRKNETVVVAVGHDDAADHTHTFRSVPLLIIQSAERTRKFQVSELEPETVTVVVNGPRGTLARMHGREISASISLDNIDKPGTFNLPISITVNNPSKGVSVKSFQPAVAKATVIQE